VPALASARWYIRAAERNYLDELEQKVIRCAEGACLMTGAILDWRYFENRYDNYVRCPELIESFAEALHLAGETKVLTAPQPASGSTDIGNVSRVCPTGYCELGIGNEDGYDVHEEEFLQYCDGPVAYAGLNRAVRTQAYLAAAICTDPQLQAALQAFKAELKRGNGK
jgi:metal-dependent amidase/aminoacylase/carboxypeptidase family protein